MGNIHDNLADACIDLKYERVKKLIGEVKNKAEFNEKIYYAINLSGMRYFRHGSGGYATLLDVVLLSDRKDEENKAKIVDLLLNNGIHKSSTPVESIEIIKVFNRYGVQFTINITEISLEKTKEIFPNVSPCSEHLIMSLVACDYCYNGVSIAQKLKYMLEIFNKKISFGENYDKYSFLIDYHKFSDNSEFNSILFKYIVKEDIKTINKILTRNEAEKTGFIPNKNIIVTIANFNDYALTNYVLDFLEKKYYNDLLIECIENHWLDSAKALLEKGADINVLTKKGKTLLEISSKNAKTVHFLIQNGAKFKPAINPKDLIMAIQTKNISRILKLLNQGARTDIVIEGKLPIEYAVETKNLEIVNVISQASIGLKVEMKDTADIEDNSDNENNEENDNENVESEGIPEILQTLPSAPLQQNIEPGNNLLSA